MEPTTQQPGRFGDILFPAAEGFPPWATAYLAVRPLDGDRWLVLMELIPIPGTGGDRTRIAIATADAVGEHWCYTDGTWGIIEFARWPDPPTHWSRHMRPDRTFEYPTADPFTMRGAIDNGLLPS